MILSAVLDLKFLHDFAAHDGNFKSTALGILSKTIATFDNRFFISSFQEIQ